MSKPVDPRPRSTAEVALAAASSGWGTTLRFLLLRVVERPLPATAAATASSVALVLVRLQW